MGTTGTVMGVSRYLKEVKPEVQIIGVQPADESSIPGIRKWPPAYLPEIFERERIDRIVEINAEEAEQMTLELGRREGIFAGISSGGAMSVALRLSRELRDAVIVSVICDRGDRYLSTGLFDKN
jgi:cysteine synthase B